MLIILDQESREKQTLGIRKVAVTILMMGLMATGLNAQSDEDAVAHIPKGSASVGRGFEWKPALLQSSLYLAFQHSSRMVQAKTRRELGGPFFSDYFDSVTTSAPGVTRTASSPTTLDTQ